jgi:hypothetical protein
MKNGVISTKIRLHTLDTYKDYDTIHVDHV